MWHLPKSNSNTKKCCIRVRWIKRLRKNRVKRCHTDTSSKAKLYYRLHEQDKQVTEKLHTDELRKLQIDSETRNRVHVAECEQVEKREADAIRLLETKHGRELQSVHEEFEKHEYRAIYIYMYILCDEDVY